MSLSSLLFNQALTASFSISPWRPLLLSLAASLLSLAGLWGLWQSARLLNGSTVKTAWKKESQQLKARWALHQLRLIGPKLCVGVFLLGTGWLLNDWWQYHHTFILWDLKVVAEPGDIVDDDGKAKVVKNDTFYFQRASGPVGQRFPRTFCDKYVPGLHDGYHVEILVATAEHYPIDCWNVAPSPLGIVYTQGE